MAQFSSQFNGTTNPMDYTGSSEGGVGIPGPQGPQGEPGVNGKDGVSPTVSVQNISDGHRLIFTDVNGTQSFDVMNGKDGEPGRKGVDGVSPFVKVEDIPGGHQVTITDINGDHTFDVMDGANTSEEGTPVPGPQGPAGPGVPEGGTTGQVLYKKSNSNYDMSWMYIPPRPNILDNWYFVEPINQYGSKSYTTTTRSNSYTIDRWKLASGSFTVSDGGIVLNGSIEQILENSILSGSVIASALAEDGPVTASYNASTKTFKITAEGKKLIAAKLEVGDVQTLYHKKGSNYVLNDPPPNQTEMLNRCLRYQVLGVMTTTYMMSTGNTTYRSSLALPVLMRLPVPNLVGNPSVYTLNNKMLGSDTVSSVRVYERRINNILFEVRGPSEPCVLWFSGTSTGLDANL